LILAKHLPRWDEDGWKFSEKGYVSYVHQKLVDDKIMSTEADAMLAAAEEEGPAPPKVVWATDRLKQDLFALREILKPMPPPDVLRSNAILQIVYGFGNASGKGFGSTLLTKQGVKFRIGLWEPDAEDESSNWKEFENVVEALEEEGQNGALDGYLVYFFHGQLDC
jgi:hypothetical protein